MNQHRTCPTVGNSFKSLKTTKASGFDSCGEADKQTQTQERSNPYFLAFQLSKPKELHTVSDLFLSGSLSECVENLGIILNQPLVWGVKLTQVTSQRGQSHYERAGGFLPRNVHQPLLNCFSVMTDLLFTAHFLVCPRISKHTSKSLAGCCLSPPLSASLYFPGSPWVHTFPFLFT